MSINYNTKLRRILATAICFILALSLLSVPISVSAEKSVIQVDYSTELQLNNLVTGSVSDEMISPNGVLVFVDNGYTLNLTGKTYLISYTIRVLRRLLMEQYIRYVIPLL